MDLVLKNVAETEFWVFIGDVIVCSDTAEKHAKRLTDFSNGLEGLIYKFNERIASMLKRNFHT
jgi:hypothetical protein